MEFNENSSYDINIYTGEKQEQNKTEQSKNRGKLYEITYQQLRTKHSQSAIVANINGSFS